MKYLPIIFIAILLWAPAQAAKHYVKTDGNDALDGHSLANAWKTIYRADTTVVANDTVLISDGTYYQGGQTRTFYGITYYCVLRPTHGGTAGHPIVYKGNGCRPILRGKYGGSDNQDGTGSITAYMDYPYITLDSLDFRISNCGGVVIDAGHITVKYCRIDSVYMINPSGFGNCGGTVTGNGWAGGESVGDCADISNCEIYRTGPVKAVGSSENNYDGVVFYDGDTVWVHDNYIEGVLGVGIKLKKIYGSSHVITIENNTVTSPGIVGIDLGPAAEGNIDSIVVRNNILYNIATLGGTGADDQTQFGAIVQNDLSNLGYNDTRVWVYNNTIDMYRTEFGYQTGRSVAGNDVHFFNNIIWDHQPTTSIKPIESGLPVASFYTDYNLFYGRTSSDDLFWYPNADNNYHDHTSGTYYTLAEWQANNIAEVTGKDAHSTIANPLFVDGANHDYRLQAGSPALTGGKGGAYPTYRGAYALGEDSLPPVDTTLTVAPNPLVITRTIGDDNDSAIFVVNTVPDAPVTYSVSLTSSWIGTPVLTDATTPNGSFYIPLSINDLDTLGQYRDSLIVHCAGTTIPDAIVPITMNLIDSFLVIDSTSFTIAGEVGGAMQEVMSRADFESNKHLAISVANDSSWLISTCLDFCLTPTYIIADVDYGARPAGVYKDTITVTCAGATNSPVKIPVTLTIGAASTGTRLMLRKP